ncbi:MAG: ATP-dependent Clp protease ATP-binding subunit [Candidatus Pacebacteria bacterium]|nr:ATP-dependent Clp protease ATP-binding subunit [Candidatus Paceibacterota bacterium]
MYFDFKNSVIYSSVDSFNQNLIRILKLTKILAFLGFLLFGIIFLVNHFFLAKTENLFLGFSLITFAIFAGSFAFILFFEIKIKHPEIPSGSKNLADYLDFEGAKIIKEAQRITKRYRRVLDSTVLFFALTKNKKIANFVFVRALIDKKYIQRKIKDFWQRKFILEKQPKEIKTILLLAQKISRKKKHKKIEAGDIILALLELDPIFEKILIEYDLRPEDIKWLVEWYERVQRHIKENKKFWEYKNLAKKGSIGKNWAAGYTITLDDYSVDWTEMVKRAGYPDVFGYKDEIEQAERILSNPEINNVLIVGQPGVGMKNIILALVKKSLLEESLPPINNKRVVELRIPLLLAKLTSLDEVELTLEKIFQEIVKAGNVILFIDEFHNYVGVQERPGAIDITGILSSYLPLSQFPLIALTSYSGLHKNIETHPSLLNFFSKVEVKEPTKEETLLMLGDMVFSLERKYKVFISWQALKEIVDLCERYITSVPFPKKAKDILEEVVVKVVSKRKGWVGKEDVDELIAQKTEIPVGKLEQKEKTILLNLEKLIHRKIINQDEAVKEIASALRRARTEVVVRKKPMGCFLFLGPTGVGKTETSKALAEIYFGSEDRMIRLDMSEFQNIDDIPRLIGSYEYEGLLTTQVRENPFSLVLLDEIEKAHPNILNLFLQVLDEGHLTDGMGRRVDFKNTIIIATSNAGYKIILKAFKERKKMNQIKEELLEYLFEKAIFRPEFINRFDAVVVFRALTKENLLDIAHLLLSKIQKSLKKRNIWFIITDELKEKIVELGYDIKFGARNMKRVIQDKVENAIAEALLRDEIQKGDKIIIDSENFSVIKIKVGKEINKLVV